MKTPYRFLSADSSEDIVYGAERPGYGSEHVGPEAVADWVAFMQARGIRRVCCLLAPAQLHYYTDDLLAAYRHAFGEENVRWAPVEDFHLAEKYTLIEDILPFLNESVRQNAPVVVHCSGGLGRTGHVLAAWLCAGRGFVPDAALQAVIKMARDPLEAVNSGRAMRKNLDELLQSAVQFGQRSKNASSGL